MWVTPANLRSALPTGQHMASTQEKCSARANRRTSSRASSGRMAETKPSFMNGESSLWIRSQRLDRKHVFQQISRLLRGQRGEQALGHRGKRGFARFFHVG